MKNDNTTRISGVTGNHLSALGTSELAIKIGEFETMHTVIVVEKMTDNVFIIGRYLLESFQCVIDYKNLTFSINNTSLPLLRATPSKNSSNTLNIHSNKTVIIPPYSMGSLSCHLKTKRGNRASKRVFSSISGACEVNFRKARLQSINALVNSLRGKTHIFIMNISDEPVCIYRNKKLGTFSTFHSTEINTLNSSKPHEKHCTSSGNKHSTYIEYRWKHNVDELYEKLNLNELDHITKPQMQQIKDLISQYRNIFSEHDIDLGCTDLLEQEIILDTTVPIRDKYYNIPLQLRPHAEKEIKRLLDLNIIEESTSNYHSPSFLMRKGNDYRLLTDFRKLNKHVVRSWQPIPGLEGMLVLWNSCKCYSKMDFAKGFYQTPLKPESRHYTATSIPGIGFFQYVKSPLGLSSSPCYFQSLVEKIFMGLKQQQCVVYLDDILSAHKTFDRMLYNLRLIFERVKSSKMLLKPSKCELFKRRIKFLGVYLDKNGISPCPEKVESINKMIKPVNVKGVRSFLGLSGFY